MGVQHVFLSVCLTGEIVDIAQQTSSSFSYTITEILDREHRTHDRLYL
jgi:hypothetical protein